MSHILKAVALATAFTSISLAATVDPVAVPQIKRYVTDLDKSVALYRDVFGLELRGEPGKFAVNEQGRLATNTPGAEYRTASFKLPGCPYGLELVEYRGIERKKQPMRKQADAGDQSLVLDVKDYDSVVNKAKAAGLTIVTVGGQPITRTNANGSSSKAIVFRDSDGMQIEILQPTPIPDTAGPGNIIRSHTDITVDNIEKSVAFYRDVLGFQMGKMGEPRRDEATQKLIGNESATDHPAFVSSGMSLDGKPLVLSLIEFQGMKHAKAHFRAQDPGSEGLTIQVRDIEAAGKVLKDAGADIISVGGMPQLNPKGGGLMYIRDVNGMIIELSQRAPAPTSASK